MGNELITFSPKRSAPITGDTAGASSAAPSEQSMPIIDTEYEFDRSKLLGAGTFGTVYRGRSRAEGGPEVAVKEVILHGDMGARLLFDEAQMMSFLSLDSNYLVRLLTVTRSETAVYVVMELCRENLDDYLRGLAGTPMTEEQGAFLLKNLAFGVKILHDNALLHANIKPSNVLLSATGEAALSPLGFIPKLADFGYAPYTSKELLESSVGSGNGIAYLAPEMLDGRAYERSVDIWALGAVLFRCLAQRDAFTEREYTQLVATHQEPNLVFPERFSQPLRHLLQRMLLMNARDRTEIDTVLMHHFLNPTAPAPRVIPAPTASGRDDRQEPTPMSSAAAAGPLGADAAAATGTGPAAAVASAPIAAAAARPKLKVGDYEYDRSLPLGQATSDGPIASFKGNATIGEDKDKEVYVMIAREWKQSAEVDALRTKFLELSGLYHENLYRLLELRVQPEEKAEGVGESALHLVSEAPTESDQTLEKFMSENEGRVDEEQLCNLCKQTCLALQVLHARGLAHGRLSPDFLRLRVNQELKRFTVKLADWWHSSLFGTISDKARLFMAPEVLSELLNEEPMTAPRPEADVWSLGALLYFGYTGTHPFDEEHLLMLATGGFEAPAFSGTWNQSFRDLVAKMLSPEPNMRPNLRDILNDQSVDRISLTMRLTKERSFDLSAGLKCRMGGLVVDRDGPCIYTTNKRDCSVLRINRESKSIDTFAKTTDKAYAFCFTKDGRLCAFERFKEHPERCIRVYSKPADAPTGYKQALEKRLDGNKQSADETAAAPAAKKVHRKVADLYELREQVLILGLPTHKSLYLVTLPSPSAASTEDAPLELQFERRRMKARVRRVWMSRALQQVVISFFDWSVVIYDTQLQSLRSFQVAEIDRELVIPPEAFARDGGGPLLETQRFLVLNSVCISSMDLVMAGACFHVRDPDGVMDEARHGLLWFDLSSGSPKAARKPNVHDDLSVLWLDLVDSSKRLFTVDIKNNSISEYSLEYTFGKTEQTLKGALLSSLQKCSQQ